MNTDGGNPLAIIFDIDGTLIAEDGSDSDHDDEIYFRPGSLDFLKWCKLERGYAVALWTAASEYHANRCSKEICQRVHINPNHVCRGTTCQETFDFVWSVGKLRRHSQVPAPNAHDGYTDAGCKWCKQYKNHCQRCRCDYYIYGCPCMYVKDLKKVWKSQTSDTTKFQGNQARTIIIENTPQQCIENYGNAVYVPTYDHGRTQDSGGDDEMFAKLKMLFQELENVPDVRTFQKCSHGKRPHACFEQDWLHR